MMQFKTAKIEMAHLNGWIKKKLVTHAKVSSKIVNPRDLAWEHREEEEEGEEEEEMIPFLLSLFIKSQTDLVI